MENFIKLISRWKEILIVTALIRIILFFIPILITKDLTNLSNPWVRWDGPHYIEIAENWYQANGQPSLFIVFFPLYPLMIKFLTFFLKDFLISSIVISILLSFISSIALFELVLLDFNKKVASLSVLFLNIFPTAYFLQASYTESLFLALTILSFYFYRKKLPLAAGMLGALSSFTRINGVLLLPSLLMESKVSTKNLLSLFIIPLGFGCYLLINYFTFGNFFYFTKPLIENWFKKFEWPWIGIQNLVNSIPNITSPKFYIYFSELITIIFITLMTCVVYFRVRKSYALYMFANLFLFVSTSYILSTPRYALSLFPIFIALGRISNRTVLVAIGFVFTSLLFYFTYLYTRGEWAF